MPLETKQTKIPEENLIQIQYIRTRELTHSSSKMGCDAQACQRSLHIPSFSGRYMNRYVKTSG